jgi:hypothetical protein
MPWVKLDDQFPDHPKVVAAGVQAAWLFVASLCYCNRFLTDGTVPVAMIPRLTEQSNTAKLAARLVDVGLWELEGDNYTIPDFLDYQPSRAKVTEDRRQAKERMANNRKRSAEVPPNKNGSSASPSRPVPLPKVLQSSSVVQPAEIEEDKRIGQALELVADKRLATTKGVKNPQTWKRKVLENMRGEDALDVEAQAHLVAFPDLSANQLADVLMGNTNVLKTARRAG